MKNKPIIIIGAGISGLTLGLALLKKNINVQILTAEAATTKKREHIYHAAMLDPLVASTLSIDEIYLMTDELIDAHKDYLPKYN